jgi:hypothetical protein
VKGFDFLENGGIVFDDLEAEGGFDAAVVYVGGWETADFPIVLLIGADTGDVWVGVPNVGE